jgi:hypothetical protein
MLSMQQVYPILIQFEMAAHHINERIGSFLVENQYIGFVILL